MISESRSSAATASVSHIYVVGEVEEPTGPVKIGIHAGQSKSRNGLTSGNWRRLIVLCRHDVPHAELRWREWLIHRRLQAWHRRGEWFDVRGLMVDEDWDRFLDDVYFARRPDIPQWRFGSDEHHLAEMIRVGSPSDPKQFSARCSCGTVVHGSPGKGLVTIQVDFAIHHLGLDKHTPAVRELRTQIHQRKIGDVE